MIMRTASPRAQLRALDGGAGLTGSQPNHLWLARPSTYAARLVAIDSSPETSAGATSHHTPEGGRKVCGSVGTTITTGPSAARAAARASRSSSAVAAANA